MENKNLCLIQARMASTRLPGKVLMDLKGKTVLERLIERVRRAKKIDKIVVATTIDKKDDAIAAVCEKIGVDYFRGSETDVLDRYYQAAKKFGCQNIIRITGDCPLIDPTVVDQVIEFYEQENLDYAANTNPPTYPDGLDTEIFSMAALEKAWREAKLPSNREHVTVYIWQHPELFKQKFLKNAVDLSAKRWTLDNPEDYEFIKKVYDALYPAKPDFTMNDILEFLKANPEIETINQGIARNEGLAKSFKEDELNK